MYVRTVVLYVSGTIMQCDQRKHRKNFFKISLGGASFFPSCGVCVCVRACVDVASDSKGASIKGREGGGGGL